MTRDPIVEARADDVQGHLDEALADVYAFVPQTPEGLFALIDVFVAQEEGKMGMPLPVRSSPRRGSCSAREKASAEDMNLAVGVADSQGALADEASKQIGQQKHEAVLRGRRKFL